MKKYNIVARREWYIILDGENKIVGIPKPEITKAEKERRDRYKCPDLIWWDNGLCVLELDGYIHHKKSKKTTDRNEIYENNNVKFFIINIYHVTESGTVKNRTIENIITELEGKLNGEIV